MTEPLAVTLVKNVEEIPGTHTLHLALPPGHPFDFHFGQFNMLYLLGVGEVPISIMGWQDELLLHTVRAQGLVTKPLLALKPGSQLGLRGPYGQGWPLAKLRGKELLFITAGLGCAPVVAAIRHAVSHRQQFGRICILQGVKHHQDLLWQPQYEAWQRQGCQVLLAASEEKKRRHHWKLGMVTELLDQAQLDVANCAVLMCGPEIMMHAAIKTLAAMGMPDEALYLSLERNFQCGIGSCGHCQLGPYFVCKDGPVFHYPVIKNWFGREGI
ncbi:FAD/NAD(P)-binding protein [Gallaecimonas kandeliae]|uniref:FAD/NAD(P)-binding protein n=1 Tax=Gallaecimonas kandeliae TaxID=3029055 RepID=UPI0026492FF7|nr:FAD/NAD(P)-binding protein [Gallaecimonas kandeliae]WKE64208.1 FAD/NAD(P)-binding protein [Gallaecimonas kandeliae]